MQSKKLIILTEFSAPCNMKCEYCYVNPDDKRRKPPFKKVSPDDFKKLANLAGVKDVGFHFCSVGEPVLYLYSIDIFRALLENHSVVINTNMISSRLDELLNCNTENLGLWWSIHWKELKRQRKLSEAMERVRQFKRAGATVWPLMVAHPDYMNDIDKILKFAKSNSLKIKLMHYRDLKSSTLPNGLILPDSEIMNKLKSSKNIDMSHWDESFKRWDVKGSHCKSGIEFLVVNSNWRIKSCGGFGNIDFGRFPEDLDRVKLQEKGICESGVCPCSWAVFHGVSSKHERNMSKVFKAKKGKLKIFYGD